MQGVWVWSLASEGNVNPLQYTCLENPMDRETWQVTVCGVAESDMTEHTHARKHAGSWESHMLQGQKN